MLSYFFYRVAIGLIHLLGRKGAYALAVFCSDIHFYLSPKDRRSVIRNLQQIMKTREDVTPQARQVFRNFGMYLVDFFLMYKVVDDNFVRDCVTVEGIDHFNAALARGKGVVILTAHIGNWELGSAVLNKLGHSITAIALPHKDARINDLFNRQRIMQGVTVIPTSVAVRRCVEALRNNKCVAVLGDRDFGSFGEPLQFFGRPTIIPKGAAFFAHRTGATIVPTFLVPLGGGKYKITFHAPLVPPLGGEIKGRDIELSLMRQYTAVIERVVRENPQQWLMFREFGIEYEDLSSHPRVQRGAGHRVAR